MRSLSVTTAWNETYPFVAREAGLLAPVAILFLALPMAVLKMIAPDPTAADWTLGPVAGFMLIVIICTTALGTLALSVMALVKGVAVGEALRRASRRIVPLLGSSLVLGIGFFLMIMILSILTLIVGGAPTSASAALVILLGAPLFFAVMARLALMTPVAANEEGGSISIIKRSWHLTRGHWVKMAGFLLLVGLAMMVVGGAVGMIAGLIIQLTLGTSTPGSLAHFAVALVSGLSGALIAVYYQVLVSRIYAQLSDGPIKGI